MRTVLFGLDGATFTVLDHLRRAGIMPNLDAFCRDGVQSELRSTPLPITPQAWTSMATGRSMGHHGMNDFVRIEVGDEQIYAKYNTSRDIHCETLWQYASRKGRQVTVLNYIGLAPPQNINGHSIPGFVPARHLRRSSFPRDLLSRLEKNPDVDVSLLGLELDFEKQVLSQMAAEQWLPWIEHHIRRERAWFAAMEDLMIHEPSDLTAIVFDGVDKIQHLAYRFLDPAFLPETPTPWQSAVIQSCHDYFKQIDDFLGHIRQLLGDEARLVIASDHGFTASTEIVYINKFLHDEGLLTWKDEVPEDEAGTLYVDHLRNHLELIDLKRTKAFALTPSCNGIFINVEPQNYWSFREQLIEKLSQIRGADGGPVVSDIKKREEWFEGPYQDHAPDLTLTLRDFGLVSVLNGPAVVVPREQPWGTHHPDGVLIAAGPGLKRGIRAAKRDILDVTPLLAHSLELEIPHEYEGELPTEFFEADWLAENPPRFGDFSAEDHGSSSDHKADVAQLAPDGQMDEEDEAIILERLKSLGYIE